LDALSPQRKEAVMRRLTIIEIRWLRNGNKKNGSLISYRAVGNYFPAPEWQGWETMEEREEQTQTLSMIDFTLRIENATDSQSEFSYNERIGEPAYETEPGPITAFIRAIHEPTE
jgi:hypothetical protein